MHHLQRASVLLLVLFSFLARAAEDESGFSATLGGFVLPPSVLVLAKGSYDRGHFSIGVDLTRDSVVLKRMDESEDAYVLWAGSFAARAYTGKRGRGGFAELSVGYAGLGLSTHQGGEQRGSAAAGLPLVSFGLGGRLGQNPTGFFGELGLRTSMALGEALLFTTDELPQGSRAESITEHAWFFRRGSFSTQAYLGLGYSW